MERQSKSAASSGKDENVLDVKPLRTLAPMFPAPSGLNTFSPPGASPFVFVTPYNSLPSGFEAGLASGFSSSFASPETPNHRPENKPTGRPAHVNANGSSFSPKFSTPPSGIVNIDDDDDEEPSSRCKVKQPIPLSSYKGSGSWASGSNGKKLKQKYKKPRKVFDADLALLPSSSTDARESVEVVLMTYDALRRRLLQLEEVNNDNRRPDLKAGAIMMGTDLRANMGKRIGSVPGIEVGDIFYFRMEMCLVGLHAPSMGGIDYMTARFSDGEDPVAIGIVSSGGYENTEDDVDVLIYSGQGGNNTRDGKQLDDQKLERGNLALERSLHRGNEIRVVRSAKDISWITGKIYIYDGLYKIQESWMEKAKSGFNVFKYKLQREPDQPDGFAVWKMTQKWKDNPSSRDNVILPDISSGVENIPVCLVNDVDDAKGPSHFTYSTRVKYLKPISSMKPLGGCKCLSVCLPGDNSCACSRHNGDDLPYSSNGLLVSRKPMLYECGASCHCTTSCRTRVTQKGVRLHFEVFRTMDRGWGLRSWDPIRAGTFICEYTGEVIDKIQVHLDDGDDDDDGDSEEDEYIFQATQTDVKFKWNYGPELLGERSADDSNETSNPLPIVISAKNMGNISRFMNHSCSPNVFWQPVQHDHCEEGYPHIMFFAMKHIPPMTELTYDYGLSGTEEGKEMGNSVVARRPKKCLCGSTKCRGLFG